MNPRAVTCSPSTLNLDRRRVSRTLAERVTLNVEDGPLCVRHANDDFPESNEGESQLWIRRPPRIALHTHAP